MCIAILKPAGVDISFETLETCYENNRDGCGLAYINKEGKIEIHKSMDFYAFYKIYQACLQENPQSPFLIHFRIATHGTVNEFNCHPFAVGGDIAFIHNGVISKAPSCPDKKRSDTQMFNDTILKSLPDGWFDSAGAKALIEEYIGTGSKLVVLNKDGRYNIYNEKAGTWEDGCWFSNYSFRIYRSKYYNSDRKFNYRGNDYMYKNGVRHMWDKDTKKYRPCDLHDNFLDLPALVYEHKCEICDTLTATKFMYAVVTFEGDDMEICDFCYKDLRDIGGTVFRVIENLEHKLKNQPINKAAI